MDPADVAVSRDLSFPGHSYSPAAGHHVGGLLAASLPAQAGVERPTCPYCELAELPSQIAVDLRELTETPEGIEHRAHREWLAWQVRNLDKRLADVRARLAAIRAEK